MKYLLHFSHKLRFGTRLAGTIATLLVVVAVPSAHAISVNELNAIVNTPMYDPTSTECTTKVSTPQPTVTAAGNKVFYIGDSLTYHMTQGNKAHTVTGNLLEKTAAANYSVDTTYTATGLDGNSPRVNGHSVEAQGGINIAGSIAHLEDHALTGGATDFDKDHADIVVIALGTNSEIPKSDLTNEIDAIVAAVRANNSPAIYWVNTYWSTPDTIKSTSYQSVNDVIATAAARDNFHVIDYATAAAADATIAPDVYAPNGADGIHVGTSEGRQKKADWIVSQLPKPGALVSTNVPPVSTPGCCTIASGNGVGATGPTVGDTSEDGNPYHILTYPSALTDQQATAKAIDDYIQKKAPTSPFVGLGKDFVASGKQNNVNPFLAVGHIQRESQYGTAKEGWSATTPPSYNAFGRSASASQPHTVYHGTRDRLVYQWQSWGGSLIADDNWFAYIRRNYLNPDSTYVSPNFSVYFSHYAPNGDGNNENAYKSGVLETIDAITAGLTSGSPATTVNTVCGNASQPATGAAAQYITDCGANEGNAAIACAAINQLTGIAYGSGPRDPKIPNPTILDCSALTGMAIYRAFSVDLLGICSAQYLTDPHFKEIEDLTTVQPGDLVGIGRLCHTADGGTGHIAVVVSYDKTTKELKTMEASNPDVLSGVRKNRGFVGDGKGGTFEWAVHYTGPRNPPPPATTIPVETTK
ncbi:MAG: mannosyl-glycoendo-beta-N-acetylglucosaminidase family protein [Candidatus Saccharibacteria bacterium]|nr:mannosyl-glycoendo-beta-N-acetylglucosaminidase family protein [Candidatus Saccharibacteria bacterium]